MAAYNSEMNRRLYTAADKLREDTRRADGGAFWHSIHGTLCHLLWGDGMWMSRFAGWEKPTTMVRESDNMIKEWEELRSRRIATDKKIEEWVASLNQEILSKDLTWQSGVTMREMTLPMWVAVSHFFNHQTHHRGQAHALITRAGGATGDTDIPFILDFEKLGLL